LCSQIKIHHQNKKRELNSVYKQFNGLSPNRVLDRGYSIIFSNENKVIRQSNKIKVGELFKAQTANGALIAKKTKEA
jgi:exodeoxyribonuclease VII large subunit